MKLKPNYIIIPTIVASLASLGGWLTNLGRAQDMWYQMLKLPAWTPSGAIISVAWTIIFILTAVSLILVWNYMNRGARFYNVMSLFVANAVLNVGWSYLFFVQHEILLAFFDSILLTISVIAIIILLRKADTQKRGKLYWASLLLYPYAGWTTLATYLTYAIYILN